ncbi:hypothetical protein BTUL_0055g00220 [Botrytis tulipae]|uniref:Uncharacterized protein n=1 Tax=Botrytis tulipae TaxID=87230 RepID=A0A4Z1EUY0_9HELO|nr:hypothetical protein BTUL_0055g00220 [Botrytis tulipae]
MDNKHLTLPHSTAEVSEARDTQQNLHSPHSLSPTHLIGEPECDLFVILKYPRFSAEMLRIIVFSSLPPEPPSQAPDFYGAARFAAPRSRSPLDVQQNVISVYLDFQLAITESLSAELHHVRTNILYEAPSVLDIGYKLRMSQLRMRWRSTLSLVDPDIFYPLGDLAWPWISHVTPAESAISSVEPRKISKLQEFSDIQICNKKSFSLYLFL